MPRGEDELADYLSRIVAPLVAPVLFNIRPFSLYKLLYYIIFYSYIILYYIHLRIFRLSRFRFILRKCCHLLWGVRETQLIWISVNLLISEKIKLLVHKTLVSLDVVSLFTKIVALSGLPSNLQKQDSKLGPFLRTKDFFGCGKSYKAVTPFSQHHTYCKDVNSFWHGRWALQSVSGSCLNHTFQKVSQGVLRARIRVERTSEIVGNVNIIADYLWTCG